MRENCTYGSEGRESGSTGLPYPYPGKCSFAGTREGIFRVQPGRGFFGGIREVFTRCGLL